MTAITITSLQPGHYGATVEEGGLTTHHEVVVDGNLLDDMVLIDVDGALVAEETVRFLLDRRNVAELPERISIRDVDRVNPDFRAELTDRVGGR